MEVEAPGVVRQEVEVLVIEGEEAPGVERKEEAASAGATEEEIPILLGLDLGGVDRDPNLLSRDGSAWRLWGRSLAWL